MKQSLKAFLPVIHEPVSFVAFINTPFEGLKLIAHCGAGARKGLAEALEALGASGAPPIPVASHSLSGALSDASAATPSMLRCLILIGPEGDFTPDEVALAEANGFQSVHLGISRLRTETAGVMAAAGIYLFVCS